MTRKGQRNTEGRRNHSFCKAFIVWVLLIALIPGSALTAFAATTPAGVPVEDIESIVDGVMEDKIGTITPGASVVIVKDGEIIFCKGYGVSDVAAGTPVSGTDTIFEIGSVTKVFTWTALMQLVEEGKVDLNADIREYIGYDRLDLSFEKPITVLDLMNHSAGFEENISQMLTFNKEELIPLEDWISREHQPKQIFEPGSTIAYSNFSTDIAGYIIQLQSGMRYEDYLQEHIFTPLGMNLSTAYADYYHLPHIVEHKALGYAATENGFELLPENFITEAPAGTIAATAEDMGHFMIAHMNYDGSAPYSLFDSADTLKEMHTASLVTPADMSFNAHGFWGRQENGVRLLEHGGNTTTFSALLSIVPEENFGICVLTNVDGEAGGTRTDIIKELSTSFHHEATVNPDINRSVDLSGNYATARTIKSSFLSIVYLFPDGLVVKDLKNGEIEVRLADMPDQAPLRFAEIEPFVFERTESTPSILDQMGLSMAYLQFIVNDSGEVQRVRTGNVTDYISQPLHEDPSLNRTLVIFCIVVFALSLIYGIVTKIIARKRENSLLGKSGLLLPTFGLLIFGNVVLTFVRVMANFSAPISFFRIHLIVNFILAVGMVVSAVLMARGIPKKDVSKIDKVVNILLIVTAVLFIFWLINYNLLAFWSL